MIEIKGRYCKDVKIFSDNVEEEALATIYKMSESLPYKDKSIRIMPDVHQGKGCVIGFSCPVDFEKDFISCETVGCDLGCTISATFFDRPLPEESMAEFEHKLKKAIPLGHDINDKTKIDYKRIIKEFNRAQNKLVSCYPQFSPYVYDFKNEMDLEKWVDKFHLEYGTFLKSIGTLGSGNHFLEYDTSEDLGKYCVCVHCGSRKLGLAVFNYWNKIAKSMTVSPEEMKKLEASVKAKNTDKTKMKEEIKAAREEYLSHRIPGYLSGEHLMGYLVDVLICQVYAQLNHEVINEQIAEIYRKMSGGGKPVDFITTTHNYIDYDFKALTGTPNMMIRKGSIRAYVGERVIIPFNMRDGISICEGKSNPDWNYTAPHGAGRIMSRSKAFENLDVDEFKKQMADAGIYTTTADAKTLDEAPDAYKPMDEIVRLIEPTVDIKFFMKPKMNIKAQEDKVKFF